MEIFLLEEGITDSSVETKLLQKTTEIIIKTSDFQKEFHKISQLKQVIEIDKGEIVRLELL